MSSQNWSTAFQKCSRNAVGTSRTVSPLFIEKSLHVQFRIDKNEASQKILRLYAVHSFVVTAGKTDLMRKMTTNNSARAFGCELKTCDVDRNRAWSPFSETPNPQISQI